MWVSIQATMSLARVRYLSAVAVLFAFNVSAQTAGWGVLKSIAAGAEVRIVVSGKSSLHGTLVGVTDDSFLLSSGSGQQTFARQEVMRVSVKKKSRRKRNALIGLAAGAGAGLVFSLAGYHCTGFCPFPSKGEVTAVTTSAGAIVGTLVGVAIPSGGWREIYKQ
jgi:hypothetical protein